MTDLNVVALVIQEPTAHQLTASLGRIEGVVFDLRMLGEEGASLSSIGVTELPDVVILEINGHREEDIAEIERILGEHGEQVTVFVTSKDSDIKVIRRLMRAGVRDVLPQPIQTQELVIEISRILAEKRARLAGQGGAHGRIMSFLNAKGGSGGSTLAVNVAYELASRFDLKVALVDLDLQFGVVAHYLDLKPRGTVLDALANPDRIDPMFVKALLTPHESGLHVLASPADTSTSLDASPEAMVDMLQSLASGMDIVIVDLPRVYMPWTLAVARLSSPLMLVVQNTLATLRDARMILDVLPRLGMTTERVEVVNNRATVESASVSLDRLRETLKCDRVHKVRSDFDLAVRSQDLGMPLSKASERSDLTKDVVALAEHLAALCDGRERKAPGLLKRFFNI